MSFQSKGFWMSKGAGPLTDGEMAYDNPPRLEQKRVHQWFVDSTEPELFPNKKQAIEASNSKSTSGIPGVNISPWENASSFQSVSGQLSDRLFGSETRTINFSGTNIPSFQRKGIEGHFGNDSSVGLSISHTMEDPGSCLSYGGIRKVKINQVKDSENDMSVPMLSSYNREDTNIISMGHPYNRGENNTISIGQPYSREDDNAISMGLPYSRVDDNAISMGQPYSRVDDNTISRRQSYSREDGNTISMGQLYHRVDDNTISMGQPYNRGDGNTMSASQLFHRENENTISMGQPFRRKNDSTISMGQPYDKGEMGHTYKVGGNTISMGHSNNGGDGHSVSMNHTYNKDDGNTISMGPTYNKGDEITVSRGQTYNREDGSTISMGHPFNKGDGSTISMGPTYNKGDDITISRGQTYNKEDGSTISMGNTYGKGVGQSYKDSNIISFGNFHEEPAANSSGRLIGNYDLFMSQSSGEPSETLNEKELDEPNANILVSTSQIASSRSETVSKNKTEVKMAKRIPPNNFPSNVRSLLSTGILDGISVKYISWSREKELRGTIKGSGYLCGCQLCNFSKVLNAYEFERHSGCKTKHPNNHIFFENGKTIYGIVQELRSTPQNLLFEAIQNVTGSPINQKAFRIWKESFQAATRELQRIFGKEGEKTQKSQSGNF